MSNISPCESSHLVTSISVKDDSRTFNYEPENQTVSRNFNKALDESDIIDHLCNCNNIDFDWCFIHQKVNNIDLIRKQTHFGFVPLNFIEIPLFKPSKSLNIKQLDQWAFKAHQLVKASGTYNYRYFRIKVPTEFKY